jgi:hypothetical protein
MLSLDGGSNGFLSMNEAGPLFLAGPIANEVPAAPTPLVSIEPVGNTWIATRGDHRGFWTTISQADQDLIDARAICADHRRILVASDTSGPPVTVSANQAV